MIKKDHQIMAIKINNHITFQIDLKNIIIQINIKINNHFKIKTNNHFKIKTHNSLNNKVNMFLLQ